MPQITGHKVCVITGGGSGIGLAAANFIKKGTILVISGRTESKLERAAESLRQNGHIVYCKTCDTSKKQDVINLAKYAATLGSVRQVIHAAGVSPSMTDTEQLFRINALGTVYVNRVFHKIMPKHSVIVDIASNSAYMLPNFLIPFHTFALADINEQQFLSKSLKLCRLIKDDYKRTGLAYAISKRFVVWYAQKCAFSFGKDNIRVVSLSPGLIATDMGKLESKDGSKSLKYSTEQRMGTPEELGFAVASLADERNGYLAGVDVLCDGGCTNGKHFFHKD